MFWRFGDAQSRWQICQNLSPYEMAQFIAVIFFFLVIIVHLSKYYSYAATL